MLKLIDRCNYSSLLSFKMKMLFLSQKKELFDSFQKFCAQKNEIKSRCSELERE